VPFFAGGFFAGGFGAGGFVGLFLFLGAILPVEVEEPTRVEVRNEVQKQNVTKSKHVHSQFRNPKSEAMKRACVQLTHVACSKLGICKSRSRFLTFNVFLKL
jgi:hypothetical protein